MRNSIILLNKEDTKYALKPLLDINLIEKMVRTLKNTESEKVCIITDDELKVNGAIVLKDLLDAIKEISAEDGEVVIFDGIYPLISENTIEQLYENAYSRLNNTHTIKLHIKDIANIKKVNFVTVKADEKETKKLNNIELAAYAKKCRDEINLNHLRNGVYIIDPNNTYIGFDAIIEKDVTIEPNVTINGKCLIKEDAVIGTCTYLENAEVGNRTRILSSRVTDSKLGDDCVLGPNSHLRMNTEIHNNVRIGNFVEFKNTVFGYKSRCAHLTYLGDATVGQDVNIGCGVITANYDGAHKYRTEIGDHSFIGSNSNLIAPVKVGSNSLIAAGSTITKDVNDGDMAIARSFETIKEGYGFKYINKEK